MLINMENINELVFLKERLDTIQMELSRLIELNNVLSMIQIEKVAGVDMAYWKKKGTEYAVCCIIVMKRETLQIMECKSSFGKVKMPYVPGYLAFRELPLVLETVKKLESVPDLYMFDGNGYLHPRHMGIATHASFYLKKPTIGVAKSYYKINDVDFHMPSNEINAYTDIIIDGKTYGRVLRTIKNVKPIFISIGNYIDLDTTTRLV